MKANVGAIIQFTLAAPGNWEWTVEKASGGHTYRNRQEFLGHVGEVISEATIWVPALNIKIRGVLYEEHVTVLKP